MGLQMQICSILRISWSILIKVLFPSANELQQNSNASREDYIPQILAVLLEIHGIYIIFWSLRPFVFCLLLVNNS